MSPLTRRAAAPLVFVVAVATVIAIWIPMSAAQEAGSDIAKQELVTGLHDPTAIEAAPDGRVFIIQRDGILKVWHPDGSVTVAGQIPVDCAPLCPNAEEQLNDDGGAMGMLLDRDFAQTGRIYFSYTPAGTTTPLGPRGAAADGTSETEPSLFSLIRVSSFALNEDGTLDLSSERTAIEDYAYNTPHSNGAHSFGGDLNWMDDGTLVWGPGDATSPRITGYSPQDNRPGLEFNNALRTAANPKSLWGKIVRMRIGPDGRAAPPDDNPALRNPERFGDWNPFVYAMGYRNPFRFAVEPQSQRLFVGVVGPDANSDDPNRGPHGRETIHTVEPGGGQDGGWPRCIADGQPYRRYDELTMTPGEYFDCEEEGVTPATFWYGRGPSPWGSVMTGSCVLTPLVYPVDHAGPLALPDRFEDQLIQIDWSAGNINLIPVTPDGTLDTTIPDEDPSVTDTVGVHPSGITGLTHPIDAVVGADGALYVLNYGASFWGNTNGSLVRFVPAAAADASGSETTQVRSGTRLRATEAHGPTAPRADTGAARDRREALARQHGGLALDAGRSIEFSAAQPIDRTAGIGTGAVAIVVVGGAAIVVGRRRLRRVV